jgi:hypothetical protein
VIVAFCDSITPTTELRDANGYDWAWAYEIFGEIEDFPGYKIGSEGTVWSLWIRGSKNRRLGTVWKRLKAQLNCRFPYYYVALRDKEGRKRDFKVSVLVLRAFMGPKPEGYEAAHLNGRSRDDRLRNLAWKTHEGNMADKVLHGTHRQGTQIPCSVLNEQTVRVIKDLIGTMSYCQISRLFRVTDSVIREIALGRSWKHVPGGFGGTKSFRSKLSDEDVLNIRRRYRLGEIQEAIASDFGISRTSVSMIVNGKSWKHLPMEIL